MKRPSTDLIGIGQGHWEAGRVERGKRYRVLRAFQDADGDEHPAGEVWTLVSTGFNKFDNELELRIKDENGSDWIVPLSWVRDRQREVLEQWSTYVCPV
jgi:hypothetical protein